MKASILRRAFAALLFVPALYAQLNENCTIAAANRTAQVQPDGSWRIDNIPSGAFIRATATCTVNGVTQTGETIPFTIIAGTAIGIPGQVTLGTAAKIPSKITIAPTNSTLVNLNQTLALRVIATFPDNTNGDLTRATTGTTYAITNSSTATVSPDGVVTAKSSGTVFVQAVNEGAQGIVQILVRLSGDSDGDGMPDDYEIAHGFDPHNPADALDDPDHDGLTNVEEFRAGTDPRKADTDGDGLTDGQEVHAFHTNPLLADTDGDGVPDGAEVAGGTDPNDPKSVDLTAALKGIRVTPPSFLLLEPKLNQQVSVRLQVIGDLKSGGTVDLTARARGTTYSTSNDNICHLFPNASSDGVVASFIQTGNCTITVSNSGFTVTVPGQVFFPSPISSTPIPGFPNNIEVQGNFAYIASGAVGLVIVDVSNPAAPHVVSTFDTPGSADGVRVIGRYAFIADGIGGFEVVDVSNPAAPVLAGLVAVPGEALDLVVYGNRAYLACNTGGLAIVDITAPANPSVIKQVSTPGRARYLDLYHRVDGRLYVVLSDDDRFIPEPNQPIRSLRVIDVTDPAAAAIVGTDSALNEPIRVRNLLAWHGFIPDTLSDVTAPTRFPAFIPNGVNFRSKDSRLGGRFLFLTSPLELGRVYSIDTDAAERGFGVDVSAIDYSGLTPPEFTFSTSLASRGSLLYVTGTTQQEGLERKSATTAGSAHLVIIRFRPELDTAGAAPQVNLLEPVTNSTVVAGSTIPFRAVALDDFFMSSVTFQVNGQDVATDDSEPFQHLFTVPPNATSVTITAKARDFAGNTATSAPSVIQVIPDPGTTLSGSVTRVNGTAVSGAVVSCFNQTATTNSAGLFSIANFPAANGPVFCSVSITENGRQLRGQTPPAAPIPSGTTAMGTLVVRDFARILLLQDSPTQTATTMTKTLRDAGSDVTIATDSTNPALAGFDCVLRVTGVNGPTAVPSATRQTDLVNFVRAGGGYVGFAPSIIADSSANVKFQDLTLFPTNATNRGFTTFELTYTKTPGQESHPVTAGLPNSFPVDTYETTQTSTTGVFPFTETPPVAVLGLSSPNGPAVAVRQLGAGRVVRFGIGVNNEDTVGNTTGVPDANLLKLLVNATGWACGR